jgi:diguanylate cyclase (GGDEF)-like protein
MSRLSFWWDQPDQYDWITTFLRRRGLLRSAQRIVAVVTASSALVPLSALLSQRQSSVRAALIGGLAAVFTVGMTILWLTRWPTRRQSQAIAVTGVLIIGGFSLVQPTGALAALACTATPVTGGYIAFFHQPKILLFNATVAVAITTTAALRLGHEADIAATAATFWMILFLNLSVPLAIWGMSRAMGQYAQRSEQDSLTGLLNRRAFADAVSIRVAYPPPAHTHLAVVMVDLDDFKRINDTHGHLAGDHALQAVADLLRHHLPADAAICRAGGEEFLVALTCTGSDVGPLAARVCAAVAGLSPRVTASVGTASAELHLLSGHDDVGFLAELITIADNAMYAAKRRGGNQAHHGAIL